MTVDSDFENQKMDLLSQVHGALSHKNDILFNKSYVERICEHENSMFVLGSPYLQEISKTHLQDLDLDLKSGGCSKRDDQQISKGTIDTLAENVDMNFHETTEELNQGKTPKETSCPYDNSETTTPSPNRFLD